MTPAMGSTMHIRNLISKRTIQALEARRAAGVRLGRPRACPDDVLERVVVSRAQGEKLTNIAAALNADRIPTPGGSAYWYPSHVSRLLRTQDAKGLLADLEAESTRPAT